MSIVLQKFIADAGVCSRRNAEELIRLGRVTVNGKTAELGMRVGEQDEIMINGKKLGFTSKKIYIKLNKPVDYACTSAKVKGEKNLFDLVRTKERLFVVGRLDKNSRGLVLLTNDGELTQKITHPSFEHLKKYRVHINCHCEECAFSPGHRSGGRGNLRLGSNELENIDYRGKKQTFSAVSIPDKQVQEIIKHFKQGIDIGEGDDIVKAKEIIYKGNGRFEITLTYGKKRQIRRMFKALGYEVIDLLRTQIASLKIGSLKEGKWEYLNDKEIKELLNVKY